MTIVATPLPLNVPPKVSVAVSVPVGSVMSSVSVWRNDVTGRNLLRTQPSAGFDSRTVDDYECPYGVSVTYDWVAQYTDPSTATTVFDELWASTAAWTASGIGTAWSVSGGKAVAVAGTSGVIIRRSAGAEAKRRVSVASMEDNSTFGYALTLTLESSTGDTNVQVTPTGKLAVNGTVSTITANAPFVIDLNATSLTVTGTGGTLVLPLDRTVGTVALSLNPPGGGTTFRFGAIKVQNYSAVVDVAETSAPVTLSPTDAWLVNVATPALSIPLSGSNPFVAGIDYIEPVTNATRTTTHQILGSDLPVTTTSGPRGADETGIGIYTATNEERIALRALLKPDIPLLIQIPPDWEYDFECGFYSVGDVQEERQADPRHRARMRRHQLPLTKVQSPVVAVENSGWSYAAVAQEFATYATLLTKFATYADLASNTRI